MRYQRFIGSSIAFLSLVILRRYFDLDVWGLSVALLVGIGGLIYGAAD